MRSRTITQCLIGAAVLLCLAWMRAAASDAKPADVSETQQLRAQVKKLEDRVKTLEAQLKQLQARPPQAFVVPAPGASNLVQRFRMPLAVPPSAPPRIWGQGECNGWTYYYVPLAQN